MMIEFFEDTHTYLVDGREVPSVSDILAYITASHYGNINEAVLKQAAQRGTDVHKACQEIDYGCEAEVDPQIAPYVRAYCDFLRDYAPEWQEIEQIHYDEDEDYCGTVDRMGFIDGKPVILDIKTTGSPTKVNYLAYCCQLWAYSLFYFDKYKHDAELYILFLKKDGKYRLVNVKEYAQKHGFQPNYIWTLCNTLYTELKGVLDGK